jgi:beta-N-acetylhexosaminidase
MRQRRVLTLIVTIGVSAVLAACASDDSAPGVSLPTPTHTVPSPPPEDTPGPTEPTASPTPDEPERLPWGPTVAEYEQAESIVADMSLAEQAGQVIVATYQGLEPPVELVTELGLGGVILMGDNVESPDQVAQATAALQVAGERPYPLIVAIDQEGGNVARLREPATEFPAYMALGAAGDPELAADVARASGEELRALGFTMVFAPDADVTSGPDDPTIASRSASSNPELVAEIVVGSLEGYADAGIVAVPKHFPGHGSVPVDSHEELPVQTAPLEDLLERDFVPFQAAVSAGAPALMVAHIDVEAVDAGTPSSLSSEVAELARTELEFGGLLVTDAQDMAAITDLHGPDEAAVGALAAGADLVLMRRQQVGRRNDGNL